MKRIIDILKQWHFQEKSEGHWHKFITPNSYIVFEITERSVVVTFTALCGDKEKCQEREVLYMSRLGVIFTMLDLKEVLKYTIIKLVTSVYGRYLFSE